VRTWFLFVAQRDQSDGGVHASSHRYGCDIGGLTPRPGRARVVLWHNGGAGLSGDGMLRNGRKVMVAVGEQFADGREKRLESSQTVYSS
jgi:hypothetical protein